MIRISGKGISGNSVRYLCCPHGATYKTLTTFRGHNNRRVREGRGLRDETNRGGCETHKNNQARGSLHGYAVANETVRPVQPNRLVTPGLAGQVRPPPPLGFPESNGHCVGGAITAVTDCGTATWPEAHPRSPTDGTDAFRLHAQHQESLRGELLRFANFRVPNR